MTHEPTLTWVFFKNLSYVFGALFLGLSPESYVILLVFMIIDTILGVARVITVHGGRAFKSMRLGSGIMSKLTFLLIPVILAYTAKAIGMDLFFIAEWALNVLIVAHAYSIMGNIHSIHVRKDVYEFDAISWILTRIQLMLEYQMKQGAPDKNPVPDTNRDLSNKK